MELLRHGRFEIGKMWFMDELIDCSPTDHPPELHSMQRFYASLDKRIWRYR